MGTNRFAGPRRGSDRAPTAGVLRAAALAALLCAAPAAATDCGGIPARDVRQLDRSLTLAGRSEERLRIPLHHAGNHLILVLEEGIDVTISVAAASLPEPRLADSPLPRQGIQRLVVTISEPTTLTLSVRGKDHVSARGRVRVVHAPLETSCAAILQMLGNAQQAYARAELVTAGLDPQATADASAEYRKTVDELSAAVVALAQSQPRLHAETLHELAIALYTSAGRSAESAQVAARAVHALEAAGDRYGAALARAQQAAALMEVARSGGAGVPAEQKTDAAKLQRQARSLLRQASDSHAAHAERYEQALAQNNLGLSYYYEGLLGRALDAYGQALRLHDGLDEPPRRAQVLQNMALVRLDLGQFTEAVREYDRVLALLSEREQPALYASVLNNSALANAVAGNLDVALDRYSAALEIWLRLQNVREQARSRNGLGYVYYLAGDYDLAFELYGQALALRTAALDGAGRASTLRTLGNLNRMLGRVETALALHREAFALATSPMSRNSALIQIARDFAAQSNHDRAIGLLNTVLATDADPLTMAYARLELGRSLNATGSRRSAETELHEALRIFTEHHLAAERIECLVELAKLARAAGEGAAASAWLDRAILAADGLRTYSANPEMQATLHRPGRVAVDLKIDLLDEMRTPGQDGNSSQAQREEALRSLAAVERARARVLAEIGAARDRPGEASAMAQRREGLYRTLAERRYEFQRVAGLYGNGHARTLAVLAELTRAQAELDRLNRLSPLRDAEPDLREVRELQQRLPGGVCIVAYWFTATNAYAWTLTRETIEWHVLGQTAPIEAAATELHATFRAFRTADRQDRLRAAASLYHSIVAPLGSACLKNASLYFVPDGALHYVPFAALAGGAGRSAGYLIETHDVAVLPALSLIREPQEDLRVRRALLISDPVYGLEDRRFAAGESSEAVPGPAPPAMRSADRIARLPGTGIEAQQIGVLFERDAVTALSGFAATRAAFLAEDMAAYTHVHIATHGSFDAAAPRLSSILLSRLDPAGRPIEGRLWAGDFASLRFDADLVVLSGCETALGRHVRGEGLMGLQYLALGRGARAVIATMWGVPDKESVTLITQMYSRLLGGRVAPHRALGAAMRETLRRNPAADPAHWAAFNVMTAGL